MKKFMFPLFIAAAAVMIFSGCASSSRMTRLSGGVFDEYSAPPKFRIRSEKYQKVSKTLAARNTKTQIAGINDALVNVWPFFFRDRNYFAILWPFIDWDNFGMAIRPFYNHEGDDYSILFPLIAWNTADKSGWVANFAWNSNGFGFIPLTYQHDSPEKFWCYYTPFFIRSYDKGPLGYNAKTNGSTFRKGDFCNLFLGYREKITSWDTGNWKEQIFFSKSELADHKEYLAYVLGKSKQFPMPKNQQEFDKLKAQIAKTLTRTHEDYAIGFVPLFHASWRKNEPGYNTRFLAYLFGITNESRRFAWDFFGSFGISYTHEFDRKPVEKESLNRIREEKSFFSPILLSSYQWQENFVRDKRFQALETLCNSTWDFNRKKSRVLEALKVLDPKAKLPATVVDSETFSLFLTEFAADYLKKEKFDTYTTGHGGFWPLYVYVKPNDTYSYWFSVAALTGYSSSKERYNFWSIPLMTFVRKNPSGSFTGVFPPFIYMNDTDIYPRIDRPIFSRSTQWVNSYQAVEDSGTYALFGLFYRGKHSFYVTKPGIDHETVRTFQKGLEQLNYRHKRLANSRKRYKKELYHNDQWQPKNKIEYYRKMIRYEELKDTLASIEKDQRIYDKMLATTVAAAKKLALPFDPAIIGNQTKVNAMLELLFDRCAELRSKEDIGNGFFFRKEKFHNGDYKWHFLHILAGGEKSGDQESAHVLQLLYRKRVNGKNKELLFFPFVSIQEDGENEKFSIMGRIFQLRKQNGKRSGYILFIPFGN
ncbi:MAG: hypothetical protein IKD22_06310 [Lentisphaeria bacterium]|nr:hypothetical protein [Lentisphaeria bacterium]